MAARLKSRRLPADHRSYGTKPRKAGSHPLASSLAAAKWLTGRSGGPGDRAPRLPVGKRRCHTPALRRVVALDEDCVAMAFQRTQAQLIAKIIGPAAAVDLTSFTPRPALPRTIGPERHSSSDRGMRRSDRAGISHCTGSSAPSRYVAAYPLRFRHDGSPSPARSGLGPADNGLLGP